MAIAIHPLDVALNPWRSQVVNNGGVVVGSPGASGISLDSNFTLGMGYNGANTTASALPTLATVNTKYNNAITGCPPCS